MTMQRRKNFFFGGKTKYEVNVYHFGKAYARGDRNVNTRKFSTIEDAFSWAKSNLDYPEVEVVETDTGRVLFSGGTGKIGNPRKKQKTPKRRDAYAEMAKARKTTRGHKRKDRRRAVRKGASRKAKHKDRFQYKARFNPPSANEQATAVNKVRKIFREWNREILKRDRGAPVPNMFGMDDEIKEAAEILVATNHPELRTKAMEAAPGVEVAQRILLLHPGGAYAKFAKSKKFADIFAASTMEVAEQVETGRKGVAKVQKAASAQIKQAKKAATKAEEKKKQARIKKLEAQRDALRDSLDDDEDMPADIAAQLAEEFGDVEREVAIAKEPEPKEVVFQKPAFAKKVVSTDPNNPYKQFETKVRSSVRAPLDALAKTREGVLLYRLQDGTTQVYKKGALTVTYEPSARLSSETIAHRATNDWRGLKPSGAVKDDAKKRRLATAVYLLTQPADDGPRSDGKRASHRSPKLIEKPIAMVKRGDKKADRKKYPMPDLDTYELTGPRANPRRRKNSNHDLKRVHFWRDYEYDSKKHKYVRTWFARRDGETPTYKISKSALEEYFGSVRGMDGTSTVLSRAEWGNLRPKRGRPANAPSETGHIYNPHCKVNGCHNKARSQGLCAKHSPKRRKNVDAEILTIYARGPRPKFGQSDVPHFKRVRRNSKASRSNLVFFMETGGGKRNIKVYKVGKKYEMVVHERGEPDLTAQTTSKDELRGVVGQFYRIGYMTGEAKYKVKHDALGLGIE